MAMERLKRLERLSTGDLKRFTTVELKGLLETLEWWKSLKESSNESFLPLFFDEHRYLVLKGGGGSGKSIFAGRKVLERVTGEPGHRFLVCRKVGRTIRDSCFAQLRGQLTDYYPNSAYRVYTGDMRIKFQNGSEILFAGLDDVEKLKSIYDITGIWIEEASELLEGDFNQLDIRLRTVTPYYLQIILSFNPISVTHWLKKRFFDFDIRDQEERRRAIERTQTHESIYKDNRFLPAEAVRTLEAFRETDPYYYMVYALGQWGVTGKTVFDGAAVSRRLEQVKGLRPKRGFFSYDLGGDGVHVSNPIFAEAEDGPVKFFREAEAGRPYVIGADTAGEGSDYFVGQVLDNITGEQVCTLRQRCDEDEFARQLYCLGQYYNDALIAVESNFSSYPAKLLELMGYRNQYVREAEDEFDGRIRHAFGFQTNRQTRPVIISELIRVTRERMGLVSDEDTLNEMLTFVRNPANPAKAEAEPGAHDDCVMSLAIAHYIRPQQSMTIRKEAAEPPRVQWTADMREDYANADAAMRRELEARWGTPR